MPSKSIKQRNFILAKRNEYKTKSKTPKKFKWIWNDDWLKIEEVKQNILKKRKKLLIF